MISCKHITKTFGEQIVLNGFSYEFANSGFFTHLWTEESTIADTLRQLETHFKLTQ